ncbi:MAG TPA: PIN domain-containing protein [Candidatus Binatia bacterium]|nr:PIN domain-containing protein [Candidatus Binatia bacterium]
MNVLIDTPVWSFFLGRHRADLSLSEQSLVHVFHELVREHRAELLGSTRQELLSGIRHKEQFERIRLFLRAFNDVPTTTDDYEHAAEMSTLCRRSGIAGSTTDMLICAVSHHRHWAILSTDLDFVRYKRILNIQLLSLP